MQLNSFSMVAVSIGRGLEPVQASPTASSEILAIFSLNSSSMMPNSFKVFGMESCTLKSSIFSQRLLTVSYTHLTLPTSLIV